MQALSEIGFKKAVKFLMLSPLRIFFRIIPYPPVTVFFLKILGAKIGKNTIIYDISFMNEYRMGFKGLNIGEHCFLGSEVMLDLADEIRMEDHVTISSRTVVLTHMNVGFRDHPLQKHYPPYSKRTVFRGGCFIGAGCIIMPGVEVGEHSVVGAGSVVTKSVPPRSVVAGIPAKVVKKIKS